MGEQRLPETTAMKGCCWAVPRHLTAPTSLPEATCEDRRETSPPPALCNDDSGTQCVLPSHGPSPPSSPIQSAPSPLEAHVQVESEMTLEFLLGFT